MVSHDHRFVFLKTRKTASTSAEMYLQPFCTPAGSVVHEKTHAIETEHGIVGRRLLPKSDDPTSLDNKWSGHMPAAKVKKNLGAELWNSYLKISAIRNPFDRMISQFHYVRRTKGPLPRTLDAHRAEFRDYILNSDWKADESVVFTGGEFAPDVLIRYEYLADDLNTLAERLGLDKSRTKLVATKVTSSQRLDFSISDYFDPETTATVQDRMAWCFERGGYASSPTQIQ